MKHHLKYYVLRIKYEELDGRLMKLTNEFKNYQQKFQFTSEDVQLRDGKIVQMEYEIEESKNDLQMLKTQHQELLQANNSLKEDYEQLLDLKQNCEKEITRLESTISELQMNFTSSHQQLKKEINRLECHANNLNIQLHESEKQIESLTNQIDSFKEKSYKFEHKIDCLQRELNSKNDEVNLEH